MTKPFVISIFGMTNSGKSTLLDHMRHFKDIGVIEVGKEMRKRYPPGYFDGKGAMAKTEDEVWKIVDTSYAAAQRAGRKVVLLDGQPRLPVQIQQLESRFGPFALIWLHTHEEVIRERSEARAQTPEGLELSNKRMINDKCHLYDVMFHYMDRGFDFPMKTIDTDCPKWLDDVEKFIELFYAMHYHKTSRIEKSNA